MAEQPFTRRLVAILADDVYSYLMGRTRKARSGAWSNADTY